MPPLELTHSMADQVTASPGNSSDKDFLSFTDDAVTVDGGPYSSASSMATCAVNSNTDEGTNDRTSHYSTSPVVSDRVGRSHVVVFEFSFRQVLLVALGAPLSALLASFVIGLSYDYDLVLNYEWTCGRVHLPSISRIVNLPKQRIIWNLFVLFHAAFRPLMVSSNYRICREPATRMRFPRAHSTLANGILLSGLLEVIFIVWLTVVGEREQPEFHVYFFMGFTISSLAHFVLTSLLFRVSYHYVVCKKASLSYSLKFIFTLAYVILLPTVFTFFALYWQLCYNFAYDFFAVFEYITILVNFGFHATSLLDCNDVYKVRVQRAN
ncbi:Post-GPI attachment to proteins factor 2-like [Toxocara canis]|uniref:Post-GPI attachment to proteins factor 2-like n=1 Tax=Toxocara canis TaxID=6265 RepID=A0A0B2W4L8_TOXCA|nr:Post-GPI attachment to proteins factor 2-like [Toxocara canis]